MQSSNAIQMQQTQPGGEYSLVEDAQKWQEEEDELQEFGLEASSQKYLTNLRESFTFTPVVMTQVGITPTQAASESMDPLSIRDLHYVPLTDSTV
jgi:hypothetical protein